MNTQLRFKLIAFLIIFSLAGLISFQGYWLYGLYRTLYVQMETNIQEAMKMADYKELFLRIQELKKREGVAKTHSVYFNSTSDTTLVANNDELSKPYGVIGDSALSDLGHVTMDISYGASEDDKPDTDADSTLTDYLNTMGKLEDMVQKGLHRFADALIPVRFEIYDSLLTAELKAHNIDTRYQLNRMTVDTTNASLDCQGAAYFDYPIKSPSFYRLYLKSPASIVLQQMLGILLSSFLLLILIIISFIYLLRTILRQKTVEQLKADFTNNMTHELKTPLSVSYAAVDALLNFSDSVSDKQRKYLAIVKEQLTHLTGLVEQILTLAVENRSTFGLHPEPIRIDLLVSTLIEQYKLKTEKEVLFSQDIPEGMELMADRTHVYNILSNLIDNALKYTDKKPCHISIEAIHFPTKTCLTITDNGPGISEDNQKHIFDKFYRIPSGNLHNVKGFGLGLYYVKDMMQKHHGHISVKSNPGKGAAFTLHFKN